MLDRLEEVLKELPELLDNSNAWDSLIINRRKPATYRVFTVLPDGLRVCLHRFDTCDLHEAFQHPHPWPGAFIIMQGAYKMTMGYSIDRESPQIPLNTFVLRKYTAYEISNPLIWHSVIPLESTYTIMINSEPWPADIAHADVRTTKGKDLEKFTLDELKIHLETFQLLVKEYNAQR